MLNKSLYYRLFIDFEKEVNFFLNYIISNKIKLNIIKSNFFLFVNCLIFLNRNIYNIIKNEKELYLIKIKELKYCGCFFLYDEYLQKIQNFYNCYEKIH